MDQTTHNIEPVVKPDENWLKKYWWTLILAAVLLGVILWLIFRNKAQKMKPQYIAGTYHAVPPRA